MTETIPTYNEVMGAAGSKLDDALRSLVVAQELEPKPEPEAKPAPTDGTTPEDKSASAVTPETVDDDDKGDPATGKAPEDGKANEPEPDDELDPQKVLSKYQTQEDKDNALVEKERFIAKLKRENAELKQGKSPEPPKETPPAAAVPEEAPADVQTWFNSIVSAKEPEKVQKLTPIERQIQGRFRELETERATINAVSKEIEDMATKEATIEAEVSKLRTQVEAFEDVLKEDPEDFTAKTRIETLGRQIAAKENELQRTATKRLDKAQALERQAAQHRARIGALDLDVTRIHSSRQAEVEQRTSEDRLYETKNGEWKQALTTVLDVEAKDQFSKEEKAIIVKLITKDLADHLEDPKADYPANMVEWVRKSPSFQQFKAARGTSPSAVAKAVDDVAPRAPSNSSVPQTPSSGGKDKTTFKQGLKSAEMNFDRALRNVRA